MNRLFLKAIVMWIVIHALTFMDMPIKKENMKKAIKEFSAGGT